TKQPNPLDQCPLSEVKRTSQIILRPFAPAPSAMAATSTAIALCACTDSHKGTCLCINEGPFLKKSIAAGATGDFVLALLGNSPTRAKVSDPPCTSTIVCNRS